MPVAQVQLGPDRMEEAMLIPKEAQPYVSPAEVGGGYFTDEGQV